MHYKFKFFLISISLFFISLMTGCSEHQNTLTMLKKAELTKALMIENTKCNAFINQLSKTDINNNDIEKIYRDATKAGCIKKDI
ncbi:MAG: hypothetical protein WBP13_08565 [Methylophilaceae bacterium]